MGLLNNKSKRIITVGWIQVVVHKEHDPVSGKEIEKQQRVHRTATLIPGVNQLEDADLLAMKKHPQIGGYIRDEKIEILNVKTDASGKESIEEMVRNIPKIFDAKLLRKLIKEDKRKPVVDAAQEQLEKVLPVVTEKPSNEHFR